MASKQAIDSQILQLFLVPYLWVRNLPLSADRQAQSELSLDYQALTFNLITTFQTTLLCNVCKICLHFTKRINSNNQ